MPNEVIKILDAFAEKFGLAVDWTSVNIVPYLQELSNKYITYEIATSIMWLLIGSVLIVAGGYFLNKIKNIFLYGDDFDVKCVLGFIVACLFGLGVFLVLYQTFDIITCVTIPEKMMLRELTSIYRNLK